MNAKNKYTLHFIQNTGLKNCLLTLLLSLFCATSFAQTQQGIVKTPTRRNVNGTITKGQYIANATVGILFANNNAKQSYVSGAGGAFSFSATSPYFVTSVTANKGTYTFLDADFSKKQRTYSANAVEVLVDDPDVLAKVREETVAHERNKIRKQIRAKEDEIEALKEANKITTAEYNKMLGELSEYRQSSEAIVQQIAEVYATTDFDKLDEFNQQLLAFVEEGDFARADSLLKTQDSKEELFKKIKDTDEAIKITEEHTQKAKELNEKNKEAFSQRLFTEYLKWIQKPMMQDSALYCLKMRADLDTTKIDAVWYYAQSALGQKEYNESFKYYQICERYFSERHDTIHRAAILSNIAGIYNDKRDFDKAEWYYQQSLDNCYSFQTTNPVAFYNQVMILFNNMGLMYLDTKDFVKADFYLKNALESRKTMYQSYPNIFLNDYVVSLSNLAGLYFDLGQFTKAEPYIRETLDILKPIYEQYPDIFSYTFYTKKNKLGLVLLNQKRVSEAELYLQDAVDGLRTLMAKNKDAFERDYAKALHDLGSCYSQKQDFKQSEKFLQEALELRRELFDTDNDVYRADLYQTLFLLGAIYDNNIECKKAEPLLLEAKEHIEYLREKSLYMYDMELANLYSYLCRHYCMLKDFENADKYYLEAVLIYDLFLNKFGITEQEKAWCEKSHMALKALRASMLTEMHLVEEAFLLAKECYAYDSQDPYCKLTYAQCLNNYSCTIAANYDFDKALAMIEEAIAIIPNEANFYDSKGEILLMQGKNQEALEMWNKVLELNPNFLNDFPNGTNLSNGLKKLGLIE